MKKYKIADGTVKELSDSDVANLTALGLAPEPIADDATDQLLNGIRTGNVTELSDDEAKSVIAKRRELFPNDFVVNDTFETDETDVAKIVPLPSGKIIRSRKGSARSKSKIGVYVMLESTTKMKNGKLKQYGVSLNDEAEIDRLRAAQLVNTICVPIGDGPRAARVMNFDN